MDAPPFVLTPLGDGRYELRAFSDTSADPIQLVLDEHDGRALSAALAEVLNGGDRQGDATVSLVVAGRKVTLEATGSGVRLTVDR